MRKILILLVFALFLTSCTSADSYEDENILYISERFFAIQMTEIHFNTDEFIGRTIRYEGMFRTLYWEAASEYFHMVYRYIAGCCSPQEPTGLEVYLNDIEPFADNAWVEVTGVLERFNANGQDFLRLDVISILELEERGMEFVPNI